jgi:uncharacterized protein YbbC (DUF1343 family)
MQRLMNRLKKEFPMPQGYDEKCGDLARYFLTDEPLSTDLTVAELAQWIQDAIEDFIAQKRDLDGA